MERTGLVAQRNMLVLGENLYPGRGIVTGMNDAGDHAVQVYWIMGRGSNSRNRVFDKVGGRVFTEAADPAKMENPSLIIYNAMDEATMGCGSRLFAVSNGEQTDKIVANGMGVLANYQYEPDTPNFTPRISGAVIFCGCNQEPPHFSLTILRKSLWDEACERHYYSYDKVGNGYGYCLTTYAGDGNPLPSFRGEPLLMPITGDINAVADAYWNALNEQNRVSLAVKFIPVNGEPSSVHVKNKFSKV